MTERPQKYAGNVDFFIGGCQTGKTPPYTPLLPIVIKYLRFFWVKNPLIIRTF